MAEDGFYGALDVQSGDAYLFMPRLPDSFAVWFGEMPTPATVKAKYAVQVRHGGSCTHLWRGENSTWVPRDWPKEDDTAA